jgi:hypothetical protein
MPTQIKSIAPTVFIVHLVVIGIAGLVGSAAQAAGCLGAPDARSAKGQHWFYRIDRASHRKCWYQRAHDAQRAARPPAPRHEVAEAVPAAEPAARPTAFAQAPTWPNIVPASDRLDVISDFPWPNPADPTRAADRGDVGVSIAAKQAGPMPPAVPMHKAPDARLSNATDGTGRNPMRVATVASAAPAGSAVAPAPESDTFTPFRMLLLFIGIVIVPGIVLSLIFRFGASTWKKTSANEDDRKTWRDSVTHNWAPSNLDAAEAPSVRPRKPKTQPVDPPIDPEQLLRKILQELQEPARDAVKPTPESPGRRSLSSV